jgi:hypothetical protein
VRAFIRQAGCARRCIHRQAESGISLAQTDVTGSPRSLDPPVAYRALLIRF